MSYRYYYRNQIYASHWCARDCQVSGKEDDIIFRSNKYERGSCLWKDMCAWLSNLMETKWWDQRLCIASNSFCTSMFNLLNAIVQIFSRIIRMFPVCIWKVILQFCVYNNSLILCNSSWWIRIAHYSAFD